MKNKINISIIQNENNKPIFKPKKFKSVQEQFPYWHTANIMLEQLCSQTTWWIIKRNKDDLCKLDIDLGFPLAFDELSKKYLLLWEFFPTEEKEKVLIILRELLQDYIPDLTEFISKPNTDKLLFRIEQEFRNYENNIIHQGGRPILKEMKYRFGLSGGLDGIYKLKSLFQ